MNEPVERQDPGVDRPPDVAAARAGAREARRRLVASRGIVRMIIGLVCFASFGAVRATMAYKTEAHMQAICLLVVALIAMVILLPPVVTRLRRRRGLTLVGPAEAQTVRFFSSAGWVALMALWAVLAACVVAALMIGLQQWHVPARHIHALDTAATLACTAALVAIYVARAARVGMWEDLVMAAGVALAGILFAFLRDRMRLEVIAMIAAHAAFASGLALHFRWLEYLRKLPRADSGTPPEEVSP